MSSFEVSSRHSCRPNDEKMRKKKANKRRENDTGGTYEMEIKRKREKSWEDAWSCPLRGYFDLPRYKFQAENPVVPRVFGFPLPLLITV